MSLLSLIDKSGLTPRSLGVTARLVVKIGLRGTLRRGKKILRTIPVTPIIGKMVAKKMQVRKVTWV